MAASLGVSGAYSASGLRGLARHCGDVEQVQMGSSPARRPASRRPGATIPKIGR